MNRWGEANINTNPDWKMMLEGNPIRSSYFWMAIIFTTSAVIIAAEIVSKVSGNHEEIMQWAPALLGILVLMAMTAEQAIRALRDARLETAADKCSPAVERRAFLKFRTYSLFMAFTAICLGLLSQHL